MYTQDALLDLHERSHRSLRRLIEHCRDLDVEAFHRELPGFGYPTIHLQLHHVIGAEEYWIGVLQGKLLVDDSSAEYPTADSLERYREQVARTTEAYVRGRSESEMNTALEVITWQGNKRIVVPAHVVLRPLTHIYHHQGQVLAMCRILGRPHPGGLDFPME